MLKLIEEIEKHGYYEKCISSEDIINRKEEIKKMLQECFNGHYQPERLRKMSKVDFEVSIYLELIDDKDIIIGSVSTEQEHTYIIKISDGFIFAIIGFFDEIFEYDAIKNADGISTEYKDLLIMNVMFFSLHHEASHILFGHFFLEDYDNEFLKMLEFDADCNAVTTIVCDMICKDNSMEDKTIYLTMKAIFHSCCVFTTLFVEPNNKEVINNCKHPSSIVRLDYIYSTAMSIVEIIRPQSKYAQLKEETMNFYKYVIKNFVTIDYGDEDVLYHSYEVSNYYLNKFKKEAKVIAEKSYCPVDSVDINGIEEIVKNYIKQGLEA